MGVHNNVPLGDEELKRIARTAVDAMPCAESSQAWWHAAKAVADAIRAQEVQSPLPPDQVYIVTTGEHDDYRVTRVFRTQALAEAYARLSRGANPPFAMPVEDRCAQPLRIGTVRYVPGDDAVRVSIRVHADLDRETDAWDGETTGLFRFVPNDRLELHLRCELDPQESDEEARDRLTKLARDLWVEIDSHMREDGWSEEQVDDWLKERDKRDVVK